MNKCPACGFYLGKKILNYSKEIMSLSKEYSQLTRQLLRKSSSQIMGNVSSDNNQQKYFFFLQGLKAIKNEDIIRWGLNKFLYDGCALKGKGFNYLKQMVFNENNNREKKLENEYKMGGRSPSYNLLEGEDNEKE
jgi:hypothetical protein|tara:strand:+ start:252 stop:656 length:405 start_codon:yes stop_codon:yes gene_type:complete